MSDRNADEKALPLEVGGMHCVNCAVAVERRLKALPQVTSVRAYYPSGHVLVRHTGDLTPEDVQGALGGEGYTAKAWSGDKPIPTAGGARAYLEIAGIFAVLIGLVLALRQFHLLPRGLTVSDNMSYGLVFAVGLVASVSSCLAVTGGLLVAFAAKYNAANAGLSDRQRWLPHIYFNAGRLLAYPLLGGIIGALGAALTLSPAASGVITFIASAVMILLGLQMLGLLPALALPTSIAHRIHDLAERGGRETAFLLGALTFFLPCGFTQALQLYVLATGDAVTGALTMLAFALGTLPALLSLSAVSSFARGTFQRHFVRVAGAAVILLGIMNLQSGLVLTGSNMGLATAKPGNTLTASEAEPQRISMKIVGLDYQPNQFTVQQGAPVEWWIDASEADGCGRVLVAPKLRIEKLLSSTSSTLIRFTPDQQGDIAFNCGMGMMTPNSKITVLPKR